MNLLVKQELSSQGLAEPLDVTAAAVRRHLETLEALGLVTRRKVVTQPSRPTFLYRLSAKGARVFPKRYDLLLGLLVEVMLERHGPSEVAEIVQAAAQRLAERVRDQFARGDDRQRWELLMDWLERELAWQADVAVDERGSRRITIHHCPFQDISSAHPAVCTTFFTTLIRTLYGDVPVQHVPTERPPACCSLLVETGILRN